MQKLLHSGVPVDKLTLRLDDSLIDIDQRLGQGPKVFFSLDLRHVGVSNDALFGEAVDQQIEFICTTLEAVFTQAGLYINVTRIGGDEIAGFFNENPSAQACFKQALELIETRRSEQFELQNTAQENLLRQTVIRSIARSFAESCMETLSAESSIDERWLATLEHPRTRAMGLAFPQSFTHTMAHYQSLCNETSNQTDFQKALDLALLQTKVAQHMASMREHRDLMQSTRREDLPLSLSLVGISLSQPLNPQTVGRLMLNKVETLGFQNSGVQSQNSNH